MSTRDRINLKYPIPCVSCSDVKAFYSNFRTCSVIKEVVVSLEDAMLEYDFPGIVDSVTSSRFPNLINRWKTWEDEGHFSCGLCKQDFYSIIKLKKKGLYVIDSIKFYEGNESRLKKLIHSFENRWVKYKFYSNGGLLENKFYEEGYFKLIKDEKDRAKLYCSSIENDDVRKIIDERVDEVCSKLDNYDNSYVNLVKSYNLQKEVTKVVKDGLRADLILLNKRNSEEAKKKALLLNLDSFDLDIKYSEWFFGKEDVPIFGMLSGPNMILRQLGKK